MTELVEGTIRLERKASVSETVEGDGTLHTNAPKWISFLELPFRVADPTTGRMLPETTGWAMDSAGRGPLGLIGSYVGAAILRMATKEAGGPNNAVRWGLKPSSLLTLMSSVMGVFGAFFMPIVGAVIDHSRHRRLFGIVTAVLSACLIGLECLISVEKNNWFFIVVIDTLQTFSIIVHYAATLAYLPDLSRDSDVISHYTSAFNLRQYIVHFFFVVGIIATTILRGNWTVNNLDSAVVTARDTAAMAFVTGSIFFGYAWTFLFRERPELSEVPENSNIVTTGFSQVARTARTIVGRYKALGFFMFSLLWSPEAGSGVLLSIGVTYLVVIVDFSSSDIARASLVLMFFTAFGSYFSKIFNRLMNPLNSYRLGMTCLGISFAIVPWMVDGPDQKNVVYVSTVFWGLTLGWTYPSQRVLFCTLIPKGQETEMMGLFTFAGQVLGWLLPLVVTLMNQAGVHLRWSCVMIGVFALFSVVCTLFMGDYKEACDLVERDSHQKLEQVLDAATHLRKKKDGDVDDQNHDVERNIEVK